MHGRVLLTAVLLLAVIAGSASVHAGDYIRLGRDSIPAWTDNVEIPFYLERTCPEPDEITIVANGFVFLSIGDVTWEFVEYRPNYDICLRFALSACSPQIDFLGPPPDSLHVNSVGMSFGLPILTDSLYFKVILDVSGGTGQICIDSGYILPVGPWKWSGMTCGEGGSPIRPLFVDKYGSDANHPICMTVFDALCGDADILYRGFRRFRSGRY
ncbi:MAG: hypothetical protein ABIK83_16080 [Candidatus Zixiibacteriota bacterium]